MNLNLKQEIYDHYQRIKGLAEEAENAPDETMSARASAMTAVTSLLRDLTKVEESVNNMSMIDHLKESVIEVLSEYDQEIRDKVVELFEERLNKGEG